MTEVPNSKANIYFLIFSTLAFFRAIFRTRTQQLEKALKAGGCTIPVIVNAEKVSIVSNAENLSDIIFSMQLRRFMKYYTISICKNVYCIRPNLSIHLYSCDSLSLSLSLSLHSKFFLSAEERKFCCHPYGGWGSRWCYYFEAWKER